ALAGGQATLAAIAVRPAVVGGVPVLGQPDDLVGEAAVRRGRHRQRRLFAMKWIGGIGRRLVVARHVFRGLRFVNSRGILSRARRWVRLRRPDQDEPYAFGVGRRVAGARDAEAAKTLEIAIAVVD